MCGIVGIVGLDRAVCGNTSTSIHADWKTFFGHLLVEAEEQGGDATGMFYAELPHFPSNEGTIHVNKAELTAPKYIESEGYRNIMSKWTGSKHLYLVGHTRFATIGEPSINYNNHPFVCGNIVGVHNGVLENHKELERKENLVVNSDVDSEVIFRLIDKNRKGNMGLKDAVQDTCKALNGYFACVAADKTSYKKLVVFRNRAPLVFCYEMMDRMLIFASNREWIDNAKKKTTGILSGSGRSFQLLDFPDSKGAIIDCCVDRTWQMVHKFDVEDADEPEVVEEALADIREFKKKQNSSQVLNTQTSSSVALVSLR